MGKVFFGVFGFAAGAVAGGLFVRWYVRKHYFELGGEDLGATLFGEGSKGAILTSSLLSNLDALRTN